MTALEHLAGFLDAHVGEWARLALHASDGRVLTVAEGALAGNLASPAPDGTAGFELVGPAGRSVVLASRVLSGVETTTTTARFVLFGAAFELVVESGDGAEPLGALEQG